MTVPQIISLLGYLVYFWADEGNEPVHVHVCKGHPTRNATKIWITTSGPEVANNSSHIPQKDMKRILAWLAINKADVITRWFDFFGKV